MASYYEEHDCEPLREGEQPNHLLHLARLLIDGGYANWEDEISSLLGERAAPPAAKKVVEELPTVHITAQQEANGAKCSVCLLGYEEGNDTKQLPCQHQFHPGCILPWLEKTNSCPCCRYELPTDSEDYEEYKKRKARAKQQEFELDNLHSAMYG